jgi:hypothetical protein
MMRTERLLASVVIAGMSAFTMWEAVAQTAPPVSAPAILALQEQRADFLR